MQKLFSVISMAALLAGCAGNNETETVPVGTTGAGTGIAGGAETSPATQLSAADATFVRESAQGGMTEVKMGHLITEKAQNSAFRDFGQRLVKDHTKANEELQKIASRKNIPVPGEIGAQNQQTLDHLLGLSGAEFDRMAKQHAIEDHQKDIRKFEEALKTLQDNDLKMFAQKTLPVLREHLTIAQGLLPAAATTIEPQPQPSDQ